MLSLTSPHHNSTLMETFNSYFQKEDYFDLIFICKNNVHVKTHKMILSTVSDFVKSIVLASSDDIIYINLPDINSVDMKLLLRFLYGGVADVTKSELYALKDVIFLLGANISNAVVKTVSESGASDPLCNQTSSASKPMKRGKTSVEGGYHSQKSENTVNNEIITPAIENVFRTRKSKPKKSKQFVDTSIEPSSSIFFPQVNIEETDVSHVVDQTFVAPQDILPHVSYPERAESPFEEVHVKQELSEEPNAVPDPTQETEDAMDDDDDPWQSPGAKRRRSSEPSTSFPLGASNIETCAASSSANSNVSNLNTDGNCLSDALLNLDSFVNSQPKNSSESLSTANKSNIEGDDDNDDDDNFSVALLDLDAFLDTQQTKSKTVSTAKESRMETNTDNFSASLLDLDAFVASQRKTSTSISSTSKKSSVEYSSDASCSTAKTLPVSKFQAAYSQLPLIEETSISDSDNVVLEYLNSCSEGKVILTKYISKKVLDQTGRRKLVNLVIRRELEEDPTLKLQAPRLSYLAACIKSLFPMENVQTYFIPYAKLNRNSTHRAKGKLVDCFYNRRRDFKMAGLIENKKHNNIMAAADPLSTALLEDENPEDVAWLQNYVEPWDVVESKWKATYGFRMRNLFAENGDSVSEYISKFPALKNQMGYKLLMEDFKILHPDCNYKLYKNFLAYKTKILETANDKFKNTKETLLSDALRECLEIAGVSEDASNFAALMVIPLLLASSTVTSTKWRPSKLEAREYFISVVPEVGDIKSMIIKRKKKLQNVGISNMSLIIIGVGPSMSEVRSFYIIVNENLFYLVHGALEAIDCAFKIIHALNMRYSCVSSAIWQFIQQSFYGFQTIWDKNYVSVTTLMSEVGIVKGNP